MSEPRVEYLADTALDALSATIDPLPRHFEAGDEVPPLWHWLFFLNRFPKAEAGPDGHQRASLWLPGLRPQLTRRMWAGLKITWHAPLRSGMVASQTTTIGPPIYKSGSLGDLCFVKLGRDIHQGGRHVISEEQELVYQPAGQPRNRAAKPQPPTRWDWSERLKLDEWTLFRYSALTFNSHRIHYDRSYAQQAEGVRDLVVQGPLLATLLLRKLGSKWPDARLDRFECRMSAPAFVNESLEFTATREQSSMKCGIASGAGTPVLLGRVSLE